MKEIAAIASLARDFVILIEDFEVPGDPGYVLDYGPVGACTLGFIAPALGADVAVRHPSTASENETGRRTGYVVLARGGRSTGFLDGLDLLSRHADDPRGSSSPVTAS